MWRAVICLYVEPTFDFYFRYWLSKQRNGLQLVAVSCFSYRSRKDWHPVSLQLPLLNQTATCWGCIIFWSIQMQNKPLQRHYITDYEVICINNWKTSWDQYERPMPTFSCLFWEKSTGGAAGKAGSESVYRGTVKTSFFSILLVPKETDDKLCTIYVPSKEATKATLAKRCLYFTQIY